MIAQESKSTDSLSLEWQVLSLFQEWIRWTLGRPTDSASPRINDRHAMTQPRQPTQPFNFQVGPRRVLPIIFTWKALKTTKECWNLVSTISTSTTTITWATNLGLWPLTVIHCCTCERMILRCHTTHLNLFGTNHENEQTARTFRSLLLLPAASGCLICSSVERDTRNCFSYL